MPIALIERDYTRAAPVRRLLRRIASAIRRPIQTDVARVVVLRDPRVMGGTTVIGGTRVPVWVIDDLTRREGLGSVLDGYPELTVEEVMGALLYARHSGRKQIAQDRRDYYTALPEDMRG